ncbi:MAG: endonuclease/exonuclease/phosphatase family protein [Sediminibacterium sp.]|jgi:exonuclease III|nr:endonuclease/exonuclease/phosphatase family protein [Sediminibacterium sp.]
MPFYPDLKKEILDSTSSPYQNPSKKLSQVAEKLLQLKEYLNNSVPPKTREDKLLLATFNIREFDSNRKKNGPRTIESLYYLAEIISSFDIIALQEINQDISALKKVMRILGPDYNFFLTDVTEGVSGNGERMAYVYDQKKILFRNIAGEIVLPGTAKKPVPQFARTPYLVSFQAGWFKFSLCTVHIYYGKNTGEQFEQRIKEIENLSMFFKNRSSKEDENFILLGDFNILNNEDRTMQALLKGGFKIPEALMKRPGSNLKKDMFYDQIVYKEGSNKIKFSGNAGVLDFFEVVFREDEKELYYEDYVEVMKANKKAANKTTYNAKFKEWKTYQMSDHLPLWVEFDVNYSKEYLESLVIKPA